jgi:transcriptional regulator with XRE-family HTH domain
MNYKPGRYPLGARLRAAREAQGFTQDELARRAGISPAMVSLIERGVHRTRSIVEISVALDVDARWLALGLGKPPLLSPIKELRRRTAAVVAEEPRLTITAAQAAQRIWSRADIRDWDHAREKIRKRA